MCTLILASTSRTTRRARQTAIGFDAGGLILVDVLTRWTFIHAVSIVEQHLSDQIAGQTIVGLGASALGTRGVTRMSFTCLAIDIIRFALMFLTTVAIGQIDVTEFTR